MEFEKLAQSHSCRPASNTSHVVVADVRRSTQLIAQGRQREVNLVGAACIAAIRNLFPLGTVPYVFGGDGATFLVEERDLDACMNALRTVQNMARRNQRISIRVGSVSVSELRALGADVRFGTLRSGSEELLMFLRGDGIALADNLVKQRDTRADELSSVEDGELPPIQGLSCRLVPFNSQRGRICSWIIEPKIKNDQQDALFEEIFAVLNDKESFSRYCPIHEKNIRHKWISPQWLIEAALMRADNRLSTVFKSLITAFMQSVLTRFVFKFNKFNGMTGLPSRYMTELAEQSDWVKANGSLYLILDMTAEEQQRFQYWLDEKEKAGQLAYGVHASSAALLTCHLHSSSHARHFHFTDGSEGGLTAAATVLKKKKAS